MESAKHKYSNNKAQAIFILASDSESNDLFGDESSWEPSDRYDSEGAMISWHRSWWNTRKWQA